MTLIAGYRKLIPMWRTKRGLYHP